MSTETHDYWVTMTTSEPGLVLDLGGRNPGIRQGGNARVMEVVRGMPDAATAAKVAREKYEAENPGVRVLATEPDRRVWYEVTLPRRSDKRKKVTLTVHVGDRDIARVNRYKKMTVGQLLAQRAISKHVQNPDARDTVSRPTDEQIKWKVSSVQS